ncbi:MAG: anthranilate phosphoribosyltransferase [Candidatus Latescibacterota bacterium]|nr:anthranilate phosphoribosyltransferase [Candidatus Latescibacterota bacterium]
MNIQEAVAELIEGHDLLREDMVSVMDAIMSGDVTDAQIGAFLVGLRVKGETVEEIRGAAEVMREKSTKVKSQHRILVDTCGTGGDHSNTFNISTTSAFVAAGAGLAVAKHGNRSVTSQSGSADVLSALGVNTEASPEIVGQCLDEVGIGFFFAVTFHGAMKHAIGPRKEIGARTIFNVLGPLTNPTAATRQVIGVYSSDLTEIVANVLGGLGSEHAFVIHGLDGMDEATTTGMTKVSELKAESVTTYQISPEDFGLDVASPDDFKGGEPDENAKILRSILEGEKGPRRDIVLLNSALALVAGGKVESIKDGVALAGKTIDSGDSLEKLDGLIEVSHG